MKYVTLCNIDLAYSEECEDKMTVIKDEDCAMCCAVAEQQEMCVHTEV